MSFILNYIKGIEMSWRTVVVTLIILQALAVMLLAGWVWADDIGKPGALALIGIEGAISWWLVSAVAPDIQEESQQ